MQKSYDAFLEKFKTERNPTHNTMLALQRTIPKFLFFCEGRGRQDLNQITREDVLGYLDSLNGTRTSSKKSYKSLITLFLNGCHSYGMRQVPAPAITYKGPSDVPRAPLKGFTAEEMRIMEENVKRLTLRERIIFRLISCRPLRISELANLKFGDVNMEAKTFTIFRSKNTKTRTLTLPKETLKDLREFIKPDSPKEERIFNVSMNTMDFWVREIIKKLRVTPNGRNSHAFRHTVIMSMLRGAQIDPSVVAHIAGNTPSTIYQNYAGQVSIDEQRRGEDAFDRARGRN